ncbi:MAG: hypothetical protein RSA04_04650 [Clostridiales bacterium]
MFKKIMAQIRSNLKVEFPQCKIYEEFVKKGFKRPCFFLQIKSVGCERELGNCYLFTVDWEICFYPQYLAAGDVNTLYKTLNDVALQLYDVLYMDGYLVQNMQHKIDDDILIFSLKHKFYAKKNDSTVKPDKMVNLKLEME